MNRLNPIKETIQTVRGYPSTLVVYKIAASRFYWVRCYFNGKYKIKTTKTENLKAAKEFAAQFYKDILLSGISTQSSNPNKQFAVVGNLFFKSTEKNSTPSTYKADYNRYTQHILKEFNQQEIDTITNAQISQFVEKLSTTGIKPATIKHHIIVLRKIMRFALANNLMAALPVFPRITGKLRTSVKRDYLTQDELKDVVRCTERLAKQEVTVRGIPITLEMKFLIQFMVHSFIRPSDLRVLKHKHIKKMNDGKSEWLALRHPATKTNANEVQAMPTSVHIYERLLQFRKDSKQKVGLDDWVFFPQYENRTTAMGVISRLFSRIVEESDIKRKTDKYITLYSLRHTSIMLRIIIGKVDTLALARNARTSQAMIDKFYAAHLTTDQVREQLHAFPEAEEKARLASAKKTAKQSSPIPKKLSPSPIPAKKTKKPTKSATKTIKTRTGTTL